MFFLNKNLLNFFKDRFKRRKELLKHFFLDLLCIVIFVLVNNYFSILPFVENTFLIIFIFIWLSLSYIFGRYHNEEKYKKNFLLIYTLLKNLILVIVSIIFSYLILFITNKLSINDIEYSIVQTFAFFWIILFSIINFVIKNTYNNRLNKKEIWYFIGPDKIYQEISEELIKLYKNLELRHFRKKLNLKNLNKFKISGFCVDYSYQITDNELQILVDSKYINSSIISIQKWCEINLECLPTKLVSKSYILKDNFLINKHIYLRFKRLADILMSMILLIISSPIIILCSAIIYLEDKGSIFYSQKRIGFRGKPFTIYKLRSMKMDAEKDGPQWAARKDKRITFIGKIMRKTRLDELPQLLCVIKGDMSLIGPRPERKDFEDKIEKAMPNYKIRHLVKPGLSGWAQVNYPYGASLKDAKNKLSYDLFYIRNFSFFLDILIFAKTIRLVANRRGAQPF